MSSLFEMFGGDGATQGGHTLWAADPHQYGPGKIHIVDTADSTKTFCGRFLTAIPGKQSKAGTPTCRICLDRIVRRPEQERQSAEYERQRLEREREKSKQDAEWRAWYAIYLKSPAWAGRRAKVMARACGVCEGCLERPAVEVHHLTYAHAGDEFLWELRAICRECHERWHRKPESDQ